MATNIKSVEEFNEIIDIKDILIICYFTASWCRPCKQISPFVNEVSSNKKINEKLKIMKIDVDNNAEITEECDVSSMPTFQFYRNNEKIDEFTGADKEKLTEYIKKYIN